MANFLNFVFVQSLAKDMKSEAQSLGLTSEVVDLKNYEPEDSLSEEVRIYFLNLLSVVFLFTWEKLTLSINKQQIYCVIS